MGAGFFEVEQTKHRVFFFILKLFEVFKAKMCACQPALFLLAITAQLFTFLSVRAESLQEISCDFFLTCVIN